MRVRGIWPRPACGEAHIHSGRRGWQRDRLYDDLGHTSLTILVEAIRARLLTHGGNQYFGMRYTWIELVETSLIVSYRQLRTNEDGDPLECGRTLHLPLDLLLPVVERTRTCGFDLIKLKADGHIAVIEKNGMEADGTLLHEHLHEALIDMSDSTPAQAGKMASDLEYVIRHCRRLRHAVAE